MTQNSIDVPFIPDKVCLFDFVTKKGYIFENKTKKESTEMKKIRFETIEMMMTTMGITLEEGIKMAFKTLDYTYGQLPKLEKPSIVILNGKEYSRPTN